MKRLFIRTLGGVLVLLILSTAMPGTAFADPCPEPKERTAGELRFEPGSYGGPGGYMPSLACCSESASGEKQYSFVLANPSCVVDFESEAVAQATADLSEACRVDGATGSSEKLARQLAACGYAIVENFNVVDEEA